MSVCININDQLVQLGYPYCKQFENVDLYFKSFTIDNLYLQTIQENKHEVGALMHMNILEYTTIDFNNEILIDIFDRGDVRVKWMVCDFIVRRKRYKKIGAWIKNTFLNRQYRNEETSSLALFISKIMKRESAFDVLFQGLNFHTVTSTEAICALVRPSERMKLDQLRERLKLLEHLPPHALELIKNYLGQAQLRLNKRR